MVLEVPGGLFGQKDVREGVETVNNNTLIHDAQWTGSFDTGSASYVDVTDATVTITGLNATKTYTVHAVCCVDTEHTSSNVVAVIVLDINGTEVSECQHEADAGSNPSTMAVNGILTGITGVTSIIVKLKAKTSGSTFTVNPNNLKKEITTVTIEE